MDSLLNLLNENAELSNAQLAAMLGKTEEEVAAEKAAYEKAGVIKAYKALIDWDKVGDAYASALIELKVIPQKETGFDSIAEEVMRFEEVESVYLMAGAYDLAVMVRCSTIQEITKFVAKRLATMDAVQSTATHFILSRFKDGGVILCDEERPDERGDFLL